MLLINISNTIQFKYRIIPLMPHTTLQPPPNTVITDYSHLFAVMSLGSFCSYTSIEISISFFTHCTALKVAICHTAAFQFEWQASILELTSVCHATCLSYSGKQLLKVLHWAVNEISNQRRRGGQRRIQKLKSLILNYDRSPQWCPDIMT